MYTLNVYLKHMSHMSTWNIPKLKIFKATIIFSSRWHYFCFLFNPLYMWFILFYICIYSIYYFIYVYICMYILYTYIILYMLYKYMHIYRQQLFRSLWAHQYSSHQMKILMDQGAQTTARVVTVTYCFWLPFLINRVFSFTKLRSVI